MSCLPDVSQHDTWRPDSLEMKAVIERIASRYSSRWTQGYVRGKILTDPAYHITLDRLRNSTLPLLDIGCGMGFLAFFLRECGCHAPIVGIDYDAPKIESAAAIAQAHYSDLQFEVRQATDVGKIEGNVIILDVLQYLTAAEQTTLLQLIAASIPAGGKCIVRGTPRNASWRYFLTRGMDRIMHTIRWMKQPATAYLESHEITAPFVEAGYDVEVRPLWGKTPFNSHLFMFERRG